MIGILSKVFKAMRRPLYDKRGQFALPSVMLIPIVLLVIYLIFETTKLSREKIRQQLALDSAAFVELAPATTYLNATAYVNGAFPYRVFKDNFIERFDLDTVRAQNSSDSQGLPSSISMFEIFYAAGAFPGVQDAAGPMWEPTESETSWPLAYAEGTRPGWEKEQPNVDTAKQYEIITGPYSNNYPIGYEVVGQAAFFYGLVYTLFGDIFDKQTDIYNKLTQNGLFFRKSYYLNTGSCRESECGKEGARYFKDVNLKLNSVKIKKVKFNFTHFRPLGGSSYNAGTSEFPFELDASELTENKGDLFQFAFIDSTSRNKLRKLKSGVVVEQSFKAPPNYFNVDLDKYKPHVRVKYSLQCPDRNNNCIWPNPTPKYQVRLTP
ncbi:hypothetical protein Dip510_001012 [Elusimicrobium posterum]|uniref:TadE/TadG family type IV pilus assembly protein n=1 Tax=Elusimicrobium posterum TaxID=3116653 RepID=UPI003C768760